jgi:DNA-binding GntR family transcriptional regulator
MNTSPAVGATAGAAGAAARGKAAGLLSNNPSLVELAADAIRRMILAGDMQPGERLVEEHLTGILGISRPPLREAIQILHKEGLIDRSARRGATVVALSEEDVQEILVLRSALEHVAVTHGVPVRDPGRLDRCRAALGAMRASAAADNRAALVEQGFEFHAAVVGLAGMRRVDAIYLSLHHQLLVCMAMNLYAREHYYEDLTEHVERHRMLLDLIEAGDRRAVLRALADHGERSFTQHPPRHARA